MEHMTRGVQACVILASMDFYHNIINQTQKFNESLQCKFSCLFMGNKYVNISVRTSTISLKVNAYMKLKEHTIWNNVRRKILTYYI